jgi:DNA-binding transcriptional LysR family regulator
LDAFDFDGGITYLENDPLRRVCRTPLYREKYVFIAHRDSAHAGRKTITWREAVQENLCLLSEDMQNRRIINDVVKSLGLSIKPSVVSNSFVGVCAHVRRGGWASIVPHTFFYVLGNTAALAAIELVEPVHTQSIGLVVSDREPFSPMARALTACAAALDIESEFGRALEK